MNTIKAVCTKGAFGQKYEHLGSPKVKIPACKTCITGAQNKTNINHKSNKKVHPKHNNTLACVDILDSHIPGWKIKLTGPKDQLNTQSASV